MPTPKSYQARGKTVFTYRIKRPDNGKRTTIRLHDATQRYATEVGGHLDVLVQANQYQTDLPPKVSQWLSEVPDRFYDRLVGAGLIEPREENGNCQLGEFLVRYVDLKSSNGSNKSDWGESTTIKRQQTVNDLVDFFGANKNLRDVSAEDAQRWKNWLLDEKSRNLSKASASKKLKDARQFFGFAVELQSIDRNPFAKVKLPPQDNPDRMRYIPAADINKVISAITDPELRLVIGLARYAGFRTPSEAQNLCWCDVDLANATMLVNSPKLRHDATGGLRSCPVFPALIPLFKAMPVPIDQTQPVMPGLASMVDKNQRTQFKRYLKQAGLTPWPRLFHNLRASALTDLADRNSLPCVCKWLGTSPKIAMKHYFILRGRELSDPDLDSQEK